MLPAVMIPGFFQVCAEHVYDWEQEASSQPEYGKYINAMLYCENPQQAAAWENGCGGIRVLEYAHPDMKILCYPLHREDGWITAREKLHRFWKNRPAQLASWKMVSVASSFAWLKETGEDGKKLQPLYGNLLGAFESGVELGRKMEGRGMLLNSKLKTGGRVFLFYSLWKNFPSMT